MTLSVGSRLGHYDVTALIGEGGMGQVYQATDSKLNRQVALKILPEAFAADPDRLARFQREAQVLASLNHPNIAAIYGLEEADPSTLRASSGSTASDVEGSTGSTPGGNREYHVAPDGRLLMLTMGTPTDENSAPTTKLILVENWFQELTQRVPVD